MTPFYKKNRLSEARYTCNLAYFFLKDGLGSWKSLNSGSSSALSGTFNFDRTFETAPVIALSKELGETESERRELELWRREFAMALN